MDSSLLLGGGAFKTTGDRYCGSETVRPDRSLDAPVQVLDKRRDDASAQTRCTRVMAIQLADAVIGNG
jgi:hypothetical protein